MLLSCRRAAAVLSAAAEEELATDLEAPGVLAAAALRLATPHFTLFSAVIMPEGFPAHPHRGFETVRTCCPSGRASSTATLSGARCLTATGRCSG